MPNNKLLAIVTVMVMVGTNSNAQQLFSIEDLRKIESLIAGKDCGALYSYIASNPRMTLGNDPLAAELRSFRQDVETGRLDCYVPQRFAFQGSTPTANAQDVRGLAGNASIY